MVVSIRCVSSHLFTYHRGVHTVGASTADVGAELVEVSTHESVETLMSRCVLYKPGLVTEGVATVLPHAVEVCLVLPVATVRILTILIEPGNSRNKTEPC